jgi:hypothetical protein
MYCRHHKGNFETSVSDYPMIQGHIPDKRDPENEDTFIGWKLIICLHKIVKFDTDCTGGVLELRFEKT